MINVDFLSKRLDDIAIMQRGLISDTERVLNEMNFYMRFLIGNSMKSCIYKEKKEQYMLESLNNGTKSAVRQYMDTEQNIVINVKSDVLTA